MKTILLNPFERYSETILIPTGILITLLGSLLAAQYNARFDGILDLHFVENANFFNLLIDNLSNLICLIIPLFIAGKIINGKTRFIDIVSISLISRIPYYILPIFNFNNLLFLQGTEIQELGSKHEIKDLSGLDPILLILFIITVLLVLIWYISLLYKGFKTSTNGKGNKIIILFSAAILIAEISSKILIIQIS